MESSSLFHSETRVSVPQSSPSAQPRSDSRFSFPISSLTSANPSIQFLSNPSIHHALSTTQFSLDFEDLQPSSLRPPIFSLPGASTFRSVANRIPVKDHSRATSFLPHGARQMRSLAWPQSPEDQLLPGQLHILEPSFMAAQLERFKCSVPKEEKPVPPKPSPLTLLYAIVHDASQPMHDAPHERRGTKRDRFAESQESSKRVHDSERIHTTTVPSCSQDSMDSSALETCLLEFDAQPPDPQETFSVHEIVKQTKSSIESVLTSCVSDRLAPITGCHHASAPQFSSIICYLGLVENGLTREVHDELRKGLAKVCAPPPADGCLDSSGVAQAYIPAVMQLVEELKVVVAEIQKFLRSFSEGCHTPSEIVRVCHTYRFVIVCLFVLVCRIHPQMRLLDKPILAKYRNWTMSTFFEVFFSPLVRDHVPEVVMLSKMGLARMDSHHRKVPREVVEVVLRPALMQFCDLQKLNIGLILGLHAVVELFPSLFKEVFGTKILHTISSFSDKSVVRSKLPMVSDRAIVEMLVHMLDLFRVFATTKAFSCAQWIPRLCEIVIELEQVWSSVTSTSAVMDATDSRRSLSPLADLSLSSRASSNDTLSPRSCASSPSQARPSASPFDVPAFLLTQGASSCVGLRAPLCRLLCIYPVESIDVFLAKSGNNSFATLLSRLVSCRHAHPLARELELRAGSLYQPLCVRDQTVRGFPSMGDCLSDVSLLVGPDAHEFRAHRVVLASQSAHFRRRLASREQCLSFPEFSTTCFRIVVDHIYGDSTSLAASIHVDWAELLKLIALLELPGLEAVVEDHLAATVTRANALERARLAVSWPGIVDRVFRVQQLRAHECGTTGGFRLLRACQAQILANLGSLTGSLDMSDSLTSSLLLVSVGMDCGADVVPDHCE